MLLQFSIAGIEWLLGLGIMFGLALFLNYLTYKDNIAFFIYLTIFNGFMVWAGLLPLWTLVVCIMILTTIIYMQLKSQGVSEQ